MKRLKHWIDNASEKEKFSILFFFTIVALMVVFAIFRFCGIGYFANDYPEHELNKTAQNLIMLALKWFELFFIIMCLSKAKWWKLLILSFVWANIYWFISNSIVTFIVDVIYYTVVPFVLNKFSPKYITYGILLMLVVFAYQLLMMIGRYSINLSEKFNYIAMMASVIDYKLFIVALYIFIYYRRVAMEKKINTPNPEERGWDYGGGGCTLIWGKFEKVCEIIGKIIVSICTLGIAPLCVYIYRKKKAQVVQTEAHTEQK